MNNKYFNTNFPLIEAALLVVAGVCFAIRVQGVYGAEVILVVGLSVLTFAYLIHTFTALADVPAGASKMIFVLVGLDCALATQATALKLGLLAGGEYIFRLALWVFLGLVMAMLIQLFLAERNDTFRFYVGLLRRNLFIIAIGFLFFLTPYSRIIRLYYPDDAAKQTKFLKELVPSAPTKKSNK